MATIIGTAGRDTLTGTAGDDYIDGGAGNDTIRGGAGNDTILGGDGDDILNGETGDDTVFGGNGNDTLIGDAGNDTLYGGAGNDGIFGGGNNDIIYGDAGDDSLNGDGGNDTLYGGDGNDTINGGIGDDVLDGGAGINTLNGGAGFDTVVINIASSALNAATRADFVSLHTFMANQLAAAGSTAALSAQTSGASLSLSALGLTLSTFEAVRIFVDGVETTLASLINQPPSAAVSVSLTTNEDTALSGNVNATDPNGDTLAYAVSSAAAHGTVSLNAATGAYTYTPAANYNGPDSFQVTVSDGNGGTVTQTISVGVTAVNDAPVIATASVSLTTAEDTAVSGQVSASDVDGDTLAYAVSSAAAHGAVIINAATGAYTYTPAANYNGADSFEVTISDGNGGTVTQTISVGVTAVNDTPVVAAANVSITTAEDTAVSGQVSASDVDGDTLSYAVSSAAAHGSVTINAVTGAYTYTPASNYNGSDSFEVTVSDGNGGTAVQTISVGVTAVNDAPVVTEANVSITTQEDTVVSGQVVASDVDGDTLAYAVSTAAAHGTVSLNAATGAYTYTPSANYNGADSFEVTVSDGAGGTVTQTISVGITAVNNSPVVAQSSVSISTQEDTAVAGQVVASDVDGDTLAYAVSTAAAHGSVTLNAATGAYTYTPAANYNGSDSFEVTVSDGNGGTAVQTITVGVAAVNDAPVIAAASVSITTAEDTAVAGQVVASDVDGDTLAYAVSTAAAHGSVTLNAATGAYTYTPAANYNGPDSFEVTVSDGNGGTAVQTISVGITAVNDAPVVAAANVSITTAEDTTVSGQVVASDADGDTLAYSVTTGPARGTVTLNAATGAYTYTGAQNYNGADSFQVRVADGHGGFATQTVSVTVTPVNDAPVVTAANVSITTAEDTAVSGQVSASDVDGDTLAYAVSTAAARGTVTLNAATGAYTYTPAANYNGADSFQVTVSDGRGGSAVQTISIGVTPVNDAPVVAAANVSLSAREDVAYNGQVGATDVDGDALTYTIVSGPAYGTISLNAATGAYTYLGASNYSGSDSFRIQVADGRGGIASQSIAVAIAAVADAPTLSAREALTTTGLTINGTSGNDVLRGTAGDDFIYGGAGNDTIYGTGAARTNTVGLSISAALTDTDGSESLAIRLSGIPSNATLSAGTRSADGTWLLSSAQLANLTITSPTVTDFTATVTATATEASNGSTATSTASLRVRIDTGTDSDTLDGGAGNDTIYGGAGNNRLYDGDGNDIAYGNGGDDTFYAGLGNDVYNGGAGTDTINVSLGTQDITVNLATGIATGLGNDTLVSIENITGSRFNDTLTGSSVNNVIDGGAGNDQIYGGAGNDTLYGGAGNDQIDGGSGNDVIYDGAGNDTVTAGDGNDTIFAGAPGIKSYTGGSGVDTIDFSTSPSAIDVDASKRMFTTAASSSTPLSGTVNGIERFVGTQFDDTFKGGKANNFFDGGAGNDTFRGMGGTDVFTGGTGKDTFVWFVKDVTQNGTFLGADTITDFRSGEDQLNLSEFVKAFPATTPLDSIVRATDSSFGTTLSVRVGTAYLDLVTLQDVHNVTASQLYAKGDIVI